MKIVGICLIKNEDLYIETVIRNVIHFCDEFLILDNYSTDNTYDIAVQLKKEFPSVQLIQVRDTSDTHSFVESYAGSDTWVFRVDGDEVYDAGGLNNLRQELIGGKYKDWWSITSTTVHVDEICPEQKKVFGYEARMTALSNFSLLQKWHEEKAERLHGVNKIFKDTFDRTKMKLVIPGTENFDTSYFRCLHLCFIRRSSLYRGHVRLNPGEKKHWFNFFVNFLKNVVKGTIIRGVTYKNHAYRIGHRREYQVGKKNSFNFFD